MKNFLFKKFERLKNLSTARVEDHGAQYEIFGIFAVANYIIPYFMWSPIKNSHYTLLIGLRLLAGVFCFLLIIKDYWHKALIPYLPLYWHFTLLYCLPFLTTFMLFESLGSTFWLLNVILALLLLAVLVDSRSFIVILSFGMMLGYVFSICVGSMQPFSITADTMYWVSYMAFFSVLVGILFSRRNEKIAQEKLAAFKSVSASIAHEMRTPLSSLSISAQGLELFLPPLLATYDLAKENKLDIPLIDQTKLSLLKDFPHTLNSISRRSLSIIDIFLTKYSNLERRTLKLEPCSMLTCIEKTLEEYPFVSVHQKKLIHVAKDCDFIFDGDESLTIHIFFNLIKNSLYQISAFNRGEIKIWIEEEPRFNVIYFRDSAIGIKNSELTKIFDRFYSGSNHGTGLGLSFCKQVMRAFGGTIICKSEYESFIEFQLFFPKVSEHNTKGALVDG